MPVQAILPLLKTFLYSAIGSVAVPWLSSKLGVQITADQTTTLQNLAFGGLIGAGSAAVHWLHQRIVPSSVKASAVLPFLLLAAGSLGLTGCASVQSFLSSPTGQVVVTAGVKVAVTTTEQKGVTAAQINSVAKAVLAADASPAATVATLTSVVNVEMSKLKIPQGDIDAFTGLELAFDAYVIAKYGNNTTVQNLQADVADFCTQVIADTGG